VKVKKEAYLFIFSTSLLSLFYLTPRSAKRSKFGILHCLWPNPLNTVRLSAISSFSNYYSAINKF